MNIVSTPPPELYDAEAGADLLALHPDLSAMSDEALIALVADGADDDERVGAAAVLIEQRLTDAKIRAAARRRDQLGDASGAARDALRYVMNAADHIHGLAGREAESEELEEMTDRLKAMVESFHGEAMDIDEAISAAAE